MIIVFFLIHCTKFANLKYLQNLIIERNFKNSKNMKFGKLYKIGTLVKKQKIECSNNYKKKKKLFRK